MSSHFKAAKIADSALASQSEILTREVARDDVPTDEEALDDLGRNADLYIFIRTTQIANNSTMLGLGVSYSLNRAKMYIIFSRLV